MVNFPLKPLIFQNFRRLRRRKFGVLCPKKPDFLELGSPALGQGPPKIPLTDAKTLTYDGLEYHKDYRILIIQNIIIFAQLFLISGRGTS